MKLNKLFELMRCQEIVCNPSEDLSEFSKYGYWLAPDGKLIHVDQIGGHAKSAKENHLRNPYADDTPWVRIMASPSDPEFNMSFGSTITEKQFLAIRNLLNRMENKIFFNSFTVDFVNNSGHHKWCMFGNEKSLITFIRGKTRR